MKALKYELTVHRSIIDFTHDFGTRIQEIFIPEKKIIFNLVDETVNVFRSDEPRHKDDSKPQEIDIPDDLAVKLETFVGLKEQIADKVQALSLFTQRESGES